MPSPQEKPWWDEKPYSFKWLDGDFRNYNIPLIIQAAEERAVKKCVEIVEEEIAGGDQTEWKEDPMSKLEKRGRIVGLGERIISRLQSLKPNK